MPVRAHFLPPRSECWAVEARDIYLRASSQAQRETAALRAGLAKRLRRARSRSRARDAAKLAAAESALFARLATEIECFRGAAINEAREAILAAVSAVAEEVLRRDFEGASESLNARLDEVLAEIPKDSVAEIKTSETDSTIARGDAIIVTAAGTLMIEWRAHCAAALARIEECFSNELS
jgi:flagellar biosynthesis/type III secretory pathway protein FliH